MHFEFVRNPWNALTYSPTHQARLTNCRGAILNPNAQSRGKIMNQYHIYEAIGHGKYSVKILHDLDHPNVLKFCAWYETSAHFLLVLEYCVGGDFMKLLQRDIQLPEDSIHDLAFDIVRALQFLHSKGIIYCDLKPSNILLDENGHTKLCDFGLARKLNDISEATSCSLPQSKQGTPCYMAPELFQDGGIHSYASDLWALGCVLYECFIGRPPFVGKEFTQLANSIISDPAPLLPGDPSSAFTDLINSLLVKDPAKRMQWPELCIHAFWRTKHASVP
ncbi:Serine/threonine-protein kinase RUNKEL-like protein [Drosera capensis]